MFQYVIETAVLLALAAVILWMMSGRPDNNVSRDVFALTIMAFYAMWVWFTKAQFNLSAPDTVRVASQGLAVVLLVLVTVVPALTWLQDRRSKAVPVNNDDMDGTWFNTRPHSS